MVAAADISAGPRAIFGQGKAIESPGDVSPGNIVLPLQVVQGDKAAECGNNSIKIDLELMLPKKEKKRRDGLDSTKNAASTATTAATMGSDGSPLRAKESQLSQIFNAQKYPEPVYFQSVDCVGVPGFLTAQECRQIVDFAEGQKLSTQQRQRVLNMQYTDIVDPQFADAIWNLCGLGWFMRSISVDGMVPCGLNDVIRIQKFTQGCLFGRHTDQHVKRPDGKVSKYSLRVFLNGKEELWFEGGMSAFHVPFRQDPVVFEPETGLALLYPQGEQCAVQEETEVFAGKKYVLRADILFCPPEALPPSRLL